MHILIVEDDADSRDMLNILLRDDGHDVVTANNGIEGLQAFQQSPTPIVISDWLMPQMDGLELCRRIRQANVPFYPYIILLTALKGKTNYLEGMKAGADDFISKPYDPEELRARLAVAQRIVGLQERVKRLEGVLPTCMYCKKIRDDRNVWVGIEQYIGQRSDASFSHGVCPDCYENLVKPEIRDMRDAG